MICCIIKNSSVFVNAIVNVMELYNRDWKLYYFNII